jgi:hypothetical protein
VASANAAFVQYESGVHNAVTAKTSKTIASAFATSVKLKTVRDSVATIAGRVGSSAYIADVKYFS